MTDRGETYDGLGLICRRITMKVHAFNPFPCAVNHSGRRMPVRARRGRMRSNVLAVVLALGLPLLPMSSAVAADGVLEIPQAVTTPVAAASHRRASALYDATPPALDADSEPASYNSAPAATGPDSAASTAPTGDADATAADGSAVMAPPAGDANAYSTAGSADPAPPPAVAENSGPPDPDVGSINDYNNQPGENGQRPSFALGGGGPRYEPQRSMTSSLILGGLLVGMVAYSIASHHHH
jgi:hypothetical protein